MALINATVENQVEGLKLDADLMDAVTVVSQSDDQKAKRLLDIWKFMAAFIVSQSQGISLGDAAIWVEQHSEEVS